MKLFVVSEDKGFESRVSIVPEGVSKLVSNGHEVLVQESVGNLAGFFDDEYIKSGAKIFKQLDDLKDADVVFSVNPLAESVLEYLRPNTIVICTIDLFKRKYYTDLFKKSGVTAFALNLIPRTTRAQYMDVLSSQASLAGYRAMIEASHLINRAIPLMMTTAGTIPAAKVLVVGAGVAGLQAIATAKRLGAIVSAFDVRSAAKEQVESLGAKFVEVESSEKSDGVYANEMGAEYQKAQEQKLKSVLPTQDIVITTAQIPGKNAPVIIRKDMVDMMKNGSVIIDLAAKTGGNCELTVSDQTIVYGQVRVVGFDNILNLIPYDASKLFAKNLLSFWELLSSKMSEQPDITKIDDDIIKATLLTSNGVNECC